jgi:hypothetical protein
MSRVVSLNARLRQDAQADDEVEVVLLRFQHPDLDAPVYVSTDNADILSFEPFMRGTRSTWLSMAGAPIDYLFIGASAVLPDEGDDGPMPAQLALEILDSGIATVLTSTVIPADVDIAVVMASTPNLVEAEFRRLKFASADGDAGLVMLTFAHRPVWQESYPSGRQTKQRFPGLFR